MNLSKNLTLKEVTKSRTASKKGISNEPTKEHLENLIKVAENVFQPCRDKFGALYVSSGYRSYELNKAIKGSKNSQHTKGQALDIDCDVYENGTNRELFFYIKENLDFDQLIAEYEGNEGNPAWVHVSYISPTQNRKDVRIAKKVNGRTVYYKYTDKRFEEIYGS